MFLCYSIRGGGFRFLEALLVAQVLDTGCNRGTVSLRHASIPWVGLPFQTDQHRQRPQSLPLTAVKYPYHIIEVRENPNKGV